MAEHDINPHDVHPMDDDSLDGLEIGPRGYDDEPPRRRGDRSIWIWLVVAVLVLAALVYFFWWRPRAETAAPPDDPAVAESGSTAETEPTPSAPEVALPTLDASDPAIRQLLETLTDHPALAALLVPDQLVRRFVASVDNIAEGVSPRSHLAFMQPKAGFHTELDDGQLVVTDETFDRYDRWARLLASLDAGETVRIYDRLEPLLQEAYVDLGYPQAAFRDTLVRAIDRLLAAPQVPADAPLVAKVSAYSYRDPELESLGPVEKHLARMGPENASRVRTQLAEIRAALLAGGTPRAPLDAAPDAEDPEREG